MKNNMYILILYDFHMELTPSSTIFLYGSPKTELVLSDAEIKNLSANFLIVEPCIYCLEDGSTYGCFNSGCQHVNICQTCFEANRGIIPGVCGVCRREGSISRKLKQVVPNGFIISTFMVELDQNALQKLVKLSDYIYNCFGCYVGHPDFERCFNFPGNMLEQTVAIEKCLNHCFEVKKIIFTCREWLAAYIPENMVRFVYPVFDKIKFFEGCNTSQCYLRFEDKVEFSVLNTANKISHYELIRVLRDLGGNKITFCVLASIETIVKSGENVDEESLAKFYRFQVDQKYDEKKYKPIFITFFNRKLWWSTFSPTDILKIKNNSIEALKQDEYIHSGYSKRAKKD